MNIDYGLRAENIKRIADGKRLYIFGAGYWAGRLLNYIGETALKYIKGILVTDAQKNPSFLKTVKVVGINTVLPGEDVVIIIAVFDNTQIIMELKERGFQYIIPLHKVMPLDAFSDYEIRRDHEIQRYISYFYAEKPLFRWIDIETINRCNGGCAFCQVNRFQKQRPFHKMSREMFHRIIDELVELEFDGYVSLNSNNEPFMDDRIVEFAKYAREKLPNAFIFATTNGTLLSLDTFKQIIPFLNRLSVDNYLSKEKPKNITEIWNYCEENGLLEKVTYFEIDEKAERFSRAGDSPNSKVYYTKEMLCPLPFVALYVTAEGMVNLCCNDPLGHDVMGNIKQSSLREIWFGSKFEPYRNSLKIGRGGTSACRFCNTVDVRELWKNNIYFNERRMDFKTSIFPNSIMDKKDIYIFGVNRQAKETYCYLQSQNIMVDGFIENKEMYRNLEIIDDRKCYLLDDILKDGRAEKIGVYIAVGGRNNEAYYTLMEYGISDVRFVLL